MNKVYFSACVIIPPEQNWAQIQEVRLKYDRQYLRWMPHINLIYPFRPKAQFDELEKRFAIICSQIQSFKILLNRLKYFHHGKQHYTIWLQPEPSDLIINLQSQIMKIVPDCDDVNRFKNGYIPHLSMGQIKGTNTLIKTLKDIQGTWSELEFTLDKIFFIFRDNLTNSRFEIQKEISLKYFYKN